MSQFAIRLGWITLLLVGSGCNSQRAFDEKLFEDAHRDYQAKTAHLRSLDNLKPLPKNESAKTVPPSEVIQEEAALHLVDLGIVLRKVAFPELIDGRGELWFSEAEISNEQFAFFLTESQLVRDDSELELAEQDRSKPFQATNPDGSLAEVRGGSTGGPHLTISRPASLWRAGTFPSNLGQHPVSFLTIGQAAKFCTWLTKRYELPGEFRLPADQEWLAAAYGAERDFPWGDDERDWRGASTEPVTARPELRTPEGLYGMWGNVSELVLSDSDGYGGKISNKNEPFITKWLGQSYEEQQIRGKPANPRQDYWGYMHGNDSRSDNWGFRVVFVPAK